MPQNPREKLSDVKTYSAPDRWLKGVLGISISLSGYVVLMGWRVWPLYQRFGLTPGMRFALTLFAILMVFLAFVIFQGFKRRKWRYEVGPEGVARLEGDRVRRLIRWDQLAEVKESMDGGTLTLRDKEGRERFLITRVYTDFDDLKRRVYEGWGKAPGGTAPVSAGDAETFAMSRSVATQSLIGGLFFLLFGLACAVALGLFLSGDLEVSKSPLLVIIVFSVGFVLFTVIGLYFLVWVRKAAGDKIEINSQGIGRSKGDGSRLFIRWADIGRLTKRERMKQLGVYDRDGAQKIMVDYQFERFDRIKDRILEECQNYFPAPQLPATYGRLPVLPNLGWLVFMGSFIAFLLWIEFTKTTTGGPWAFALVILIFVGSYFAVLFAESKLVKALTLEGDGIVLYRIFNKTAVSWKEIQEVRLDSASTRGGRYMFTKISTTTGKEFTLSWVIGNQLDAYIAMKQGLEKRR